MYTINSVLNRIHEWSEPEQHIMKSIFLTRIATLVCLSLETIILTSSTIDVGLQGARKLKFYASQIIGNLHSNKMSATSTSERYTVDLKKTLFEICCIIIGLASTLLIGLIFSPELNFKIHLKLGLAVDNLTVKKQKELKAKHETEAASKEIIKSRLEHLAKFQADRQKTKDLEEQRNAYDPHIAELLLSSILEPIQISNQNPLPL